MSAYGLARRAGGALAEVPTEVTYAPAPQPHQDALAERVGDTPVVTGGGGGGQTPAPANPAAQSPADSRRELLLLIPGEAITAFLTVLGLGSIFTGTATASGSSDALLGAASTDGTLIAWAWGGIAAGLIVGLYFTIRGFRDAVNPPSTLAKVLVTLLSVLSFLAIAFQTPGNPLALQFGLPLAVGTAATAIIAVVFIPILRNENLLS